MAENPGLRWIEKKPNKRQTCQSTKNVKKSVERKGRRKGLERKHKAVSARKKRKISRKKCQNKAGQDVRKVWC